MDNMEEKFLLSHLEDLARRAGQIGACCSRFLTPAEQARATQAFANRRDVTLSFDGGYDGAERQLAIFLQPDWGSYRQEEELCALRLTYRRQDTLTHRDILGAAMALGIKRELLGDIEAANPGFVVCTADIAPFLAEQLTQAGRVGLKLSAISPQELPARRQEMEQLRDTVASPRLDAVAAAAFRTSRTEAVRAIEAGFIQLNHQEALSPTKLVAEGDLLSFRGKGRARVLELGGESRKGRIWLTIGRYQ